MIFYNYLSNKKEEFKLLVENKITMYACGITVCDDCHIGHAKIPILNRNATNH
jgi:cysteinyl-tRNA synthetase